MRSCLAPASVFEHVLYVSMVRRENHSTSATNDAAQGVKSPDHTEHLELPRFCSNVPAREVSVGLLCLRHTPRQVCYGVDFVAHPLEAEGAKADLGGISEHFDVFREIDKIELLLPFYCALELRT